MNIKIGFYERPSITYEDGISINFTDQENFLKIKRNNEVTVYHKLSDITSVSFNEKE